MTIHKYKVGDEVEAAKSVDKRTAVPNYETAIIRGLLGIDHHYLVEFRTDPGVNVERFVWWEN